MMHRDYKSRPTVTAILQYIDKMERQALPSPKEDKHKTGMQLKKQTLYKSKRVCIRSQFMQKQD